MLRFKQSTWLKTCIDFNTRQRSLAGEQQRIWEDAREFEEPCKRRTDYRCSYFTQTGCNPITDCLTVVQCKVATLTLNRPRHVGFSLLELSKLHMYDFHYNHMRLKYPHANQLRLLFTDMDSLAYAVQTDDIYRFMADDAASRYDIIEYPLDHPLYDASNRKHLDYSKMN